MTNTNNNTRNEQSAAEIDFSGFNRSYIVGVAFHKDGSHGILMFDLRTTKNESEYPFMVAPKFSLVEPIRADTMDADEIAKGFYDGSLYTCGAPRRLLSLGIIGWGEEYLFRRIRDDRFTSSELTHIAYLTPDEHSAMGAFASADLMMHCQWGDDDTTPRVAVISADVLSSLVEKFNVGFIAIPSQNSMNVETSELNRFRKGFTRAFVKFTMAPASPE